MGRSKASRQRHKAHQEAANRGKIEPDKAMAHAMALPKTQRGWKPRDEKLANMQMPSHTPAKSFTERLAQGFTRWG